MRQTHNPTITLKIVLHKFGPLALQSKNSFQYNFYNRNRKNLMEKRFFFN